jgi:hypothetical protein
MFIILITAREENILMYAAEQGIMANTSENQKSLILEIN